MRKFFLIFIFISFLFITSSANAQEKDLFITLKKSQMNEEDLNEYEKYVENFKETIIYKVYERVWCQNIKKCLSFKKDFYVSEKDIFFKKNKGPDFTLKGSIEVRSFNEIGAEMECFFPKSERFSLGLLIENDFNDNEFKFLFQIKISNPFSFLKF